MKQGSMKLKANAGPVMSQLTVSVSVCVCVCVHGVLSCTGTAATMPSTQLQQQWCSKVRMRDPQL